MALEVLKIVGSIAGIGGIALGVVLLLYRDIIRKRVFPKLSRQNGFRLLVLISVLVFLIAALGIVAWVWVSIGSAAQGAQPIISNLSVTPQRAYKVEHDLKAGALAFVDDVYVFTRIPAFLEGADYIKALNSDKCPDDPAFFTIRFEVNRPVTVYVAHDDRYMEKPSWLDDFVKIEESISLNLPGSVNGRYSLYAKDYSTGPVALGSNIIADCRIEGNYGMYSIIVMPR